MNAPSSPPHMKPMPNPGPPPNSPKPPGPRPRPPKLGSNAPTPSVPTKLDVVCSKPAGATEKVDAMLRASLLAGEAVSRHATAVTQSTASELIRNLFIAPSCSSLERKTRRRRDDPDYA